MNVQDGLMRIIVLSDLFSMMKKMKIAITILDTLIWMARLLWRTITMIPLL